MIQKVPQKFKEVFAKAISYFPELKNASILIHEMHFYGVQHTCRSYPPIVILHWRKRNWTYPIVINKNKSFNMPINNMSFNEQVGLFVHELSHIATYVKFNRREIIRFSIKYFFNKAFVRKIEKETDLRAIKNGAGIYLLEERIFEKKYRINNPYPEVEDTYLLPSEIIENLKRYPDLYSKEQIEKCFTKLKAIEILNSVAFLPKISFVRKIKHALKTIIAFIPAFSEMFYIVTIKKIHLEQ
ncbi:MAG: hypothetical protein WC662_03750 [Candidatus Paceibacterota bacterium]|jgi:hypothetical protein